MPILMAILINSKSINLNTYYFYVNKIRISIYSSYAIYFSNVFIIVSAII